MPNHLCHAGGMKIKKSHWFTLEKAGGTLAFLGKARLIRKFDGKNELIGGTAEDRSTARKWRSLFAPEVAFSDAYRHELVLSA
jgi:hypothetical protein